MFLSVSTYTVGYWEEPFSVGLCEKCVKEKKTENDELEILDKRTFVLTAVKKQKIRY